jgi:hypothetical protein
MKHSFDPLKNIIYKKAREIADIYIRSLRREKTRSRSAPAKRTLLRMLLDDAAVRDRGLRLLPELLDTEIAILKIAHSVNSGII